MNLTGGVARGITRLRRDPWNPYAYVELQTYPDGKVNAVATLHDISTPPAGYGVALWDLPDDDAWEPYTGLLAGDPDRRVYVPEGPPVRIQEGGTR
jgi:hypothetical protein